MKKISLIVCFLVGMILGVKAQTVNSTSNDKICDSGITFEISSNPGWGYGEPVILAVQPFSAAERAGIKVGDIIMEINSVATYMRDNRTVSSWLQDPKNQEMRLTVRNVDTYFKEYTIYRQCKNANSISEFALASAYSFYSIEDTSQRGFSLPLKVDPNINADFSDYHTFDFVDEGNNVPEIDKQINKYVERALVGRGLKRETKDPDIIVQSYYTYQPNLKYDSKTNSKNIKTWRYDIESKKMVQVPIISAEDPNAEHKGQYVLELGIRLFDRKYLDENNLTQIWDCKSKEFLANEFTLQEYARLHAPLMLMQYPYSTPKSVAKYVVDFRSFNYTGMNFDASDMKTISGVDHDSPAYRAGIRTGDVILKINNLKFDYTVEELENGYRRFIIETMPLRDKKTRFIDANGFPDCMYWDKSKYSEVPDAFKKDAFYMPCFSYLYAFEEYVGTSSSGLSVEVRTSTGEIKSLNIVPQRQKSIVVKTL